MHCGAPIMEGDERETGCEWCECEICPRLLMPSFERFGPKRGASWTGEIPSIRGFFRTEGGELRIVEKGGEVPPFCFLFPPPFLFSFFFFFLVKKGRGEG